MIYLVLATLIVTSPVWAMALVQFIILGSLTLATTCVVAALALVLGTALALVYAAHVTSTALATLAH